MYKYAPNWNCVLRLSHGSSLQICSKQLADWSTLNDVSDLVSSTSEVHDEQHVGPPTVLTVSPVRTWNFGKHWTTPGVTIGGEIDV